MSIFSKTNKIMNITLIHTAFISHVHVTKTTLQKPDTITKHYKNIAVCASAE